MRTVNPEQLYNSDHEEEEKKREREIWTKELRHNPFVEEAFRRPKEVKEIIRTVFRIDILQRYIKSEELLMAQHNNFALYKDLMQEIENPFGDLDGKEIKKGDKKIGEMRVNREPNPVSKPEDENRVSFFWELEIILETDDLDEAMGIVHGIIGEERRIDYLDIQELSECIAGSGFQDNGIYVKKIYHINPKELED